MRFLIDTNILIPLEPATSGDIAPNTSAVMEFQRQASQAGCQVLVHPAVTHDLQRDRDSERRVLRNAVLARYPTLTHPPDSASLPRERVAQAPRYSNDWVDNQLLAALQADAVDYLVSEDLGLHAKARRLDLESRAVTIAEALGLLADFFERVPQPPPSVCVIPCYALDIHDPFFTTLRADYPGFDNWFRQKCCREQRQAYVIRDSTLTAIGALAILKTETTAPSGATGKALKLCTFKVSELMVGRKYGECLLRAVWDFAYTNRYERMYFTVHPRHARLMAFAEAFGFSRIAHWINDVGECAMEKPMARAHIESEALDALQYHKRYGPGTCRPNAETVFLVPIKPGYCRLLFPSVDQEPDLFPDLRPCGNSIRKAYLCHSRIRSIQAGSTLFFYRSEDRRALTAIGVAEESKHLQDAAAIARLVGNRTVYSYQEIERLCQRKTLCLLFRFVGATKPKLDLMALQRLGIINGAPQSILHLPSEKARLLLANIQIP